VPLEKDGPIHLLVTPWQIPPVQLGIKPVLGGHLPDAAVIDDPKLACSIHMVMVLRGDL